MTLSRHSSIVGFPWILEQRWLKVGEKMVEIRQRVASYWSHTIIRAHQCLPVWLACVTSAGPFTCAVNTTIIAPQLHRTYSLFFYYLNSCMSIQLFIIVIDRLAKIRCYASKHTNSQFITIQQLRDLRKAYCIQPMHIFLYTCKTKWVLKSRMGLKFL